MKGQRGFTLLELLVATAILGIAVSALLGGFSTSMGNAARVFEYDAAALAAKQKMEELLVEPDLPRFQEISGSFGPGVRWSARMTPFDIAPARMTGSPVVDRIDLRATWQSGSRLREIRLEGYRPGFLREADFAAGVLRQ